MEVLPHPTRIVTRKLIELERFTLEDSASIEVSTTLASDSHDHIDLGVDIFVTITPLHEQLAIRPQRQCHSSMWLGIFRPELVEGWDGSAWAVD